MERRKNSFGKSALLLLMLVFCAIGTFRAVVSILLFVAELRGTLPPIEEAIKTRREELRLCVKGMLSLQQIAVIKSGDESDKIFEEIDSYKTNITRMELQPDGEFEIIYARNILKMMENMERKPAFLRREDISNLILGGYPYNEIQLPYAILFDIDHNDFDDLIVLLKRGENLLLAAFVNRKTEYEFIPIDVFPLEESLYYIGGIYAGIYFVPPPYEDNFHGPYNETARGCLPPHYSEKDCEPGPYQIKLRIKDDKVYYYERDGNSFRKGEKRASY